MNTKEFTTTFALLKEGKINASDVLGMDLTDKQKDKVTNFAAAKPESASTEEAPAAPEATEEAPATPVDANTADTVNTGEVKKEEAPAAPEAPKTREERANEIREGLKAKSVKAYKEAKKELRAAVTDYDKEARTFAGWLKTIVRHAQSKPDGLTTIETKAIAVLKKIGDITGAPIDLTKEPSQIVRYIIKLVRRHHPYTWVIGESTDKDGHKHAITDFCTLRAVKSVNVLVGKARTPETRTYYTPVTASNYRILEDTLTGAAYNLKPSIMLAPRKAERDGEGGEIISAKTYYYSAELATLSTLHQNGIPTNLTQVSEFLAVQIESHELNGRFTKLEASTAEAKTKATVKANEVAVITTK